MILTVTLNPSIDKLYLLPAVEPESVMRVQEVHNSAGGKGLNVSRVAALLGEPVTAMGFLGGHNGAYLRSLIREPNILPAFTEIQGETRCCINCWDLSSGKSTEYLEPGVPVSPEEVNRFLHDFDERLPGANAVTISGSIPKGVPEGIYGELIRRCKQVGIPILVDTSGRLLQRAAAEKPDFLKPNTDEIRQLTGSLLEGADDYVGAARQLHRSGIGCAVVSMGADGALLACNAGIWKGCSPRIVPRNTVGCGDSMVAAFAVGVARKLPVEESFRMALAVSAANALSLFTGFFERADYARLYAQISLERIE